MSLEYILLGLLVVAPLALGATLAALTGRVRLAYYPALCLALLEPTLVAAGAASFGFRWQGSALETGAALAGCVTFTALAGALRAPPLSATSPRPDSPAAP